MAPKYNLLFVPHFKDRKKISPIRAKICKEVHSTQALQYPVHMSLISGGFQVKDYSKFEQELRLLCSKEKSLKLKTEKFTAVLPERFWTGIHVVRTDEITELQNRLQTLRNKFAFKKEEHKFHPLHITLAFPAKVDGLAKIKCPINSMNLNRITIVKKEKELAPYRIFKHIKIA
jgi:2'-5' RNA ligase